MMKDFLHILRRLWKPDACSRRHIQNTKSAELDVYKRQGVDGVAGAVALVGVYAEADVWAHGFTAV